jgi:hypothetical protein
VSFEQAAADRIASGSRWRRNERFGFTVELVRRAFL